MSDPWGEVDDSKSGQPILITPKSNPEERKNESSNEIKNPSSDDP